MTTLSNTCEGGTNGTTVSAGNSGGASGDAFSISKGATSTLAFSTAHPAHGTMGIRSNAISGESNFVQWGSLFNSASLASRHYVYLTNTPTTSSPLAMMRNASATVAQLMHHSDGGFRFIDFASGSIDPGWTHPSLNTVYRVEWIITVATTTTGRLQAKYFLGDSTTPIGSYDQSIHNFSTANLTSIRYGRPSAVATAHDVYMDSFSAVDQSTFIGPYGVNVAPTVSAGPDQSVLASTLVTLAGSATDTDGTISDTTWTQVINYPDVPIVTLSNIHSLTPTFTPTTSCVLQFTLTATDDDGATNSDDVIIRVRGTSAKVWRVTANTGAFTAVGGGDLTEVVNDANNATYAQSPTAPAGALITYELTPLTAGIVTVAIDNTASSASPAVTRNVKIFVNGVQDANGNYTLGTSVANDTLATAGSAVADATVTVQVTDTQ